MSVLSATLCLKFGSNSDPFTYVQNRVAACCCHVSLQKLNTAPQQAKPALEASRLPAEHMHSKQLCWQATYVAVSAYLRCARAWRQQH